MVGEEYKKQVKLLLDVLPIVAKQSCFALKGGTAINLFLSDLPRLSVDIDLTYLPLKSRSESLREIHDALRAIAKEVLVSLKGLYPGIKVHEMRAADNQIVRLMVQGGGVLVKIEPNLVIRGQVFPGETRAISDAVAKMFNLELESPLMSVPDIYGGKICAALDRQHPRDLFDIKKMYDGVGLTDEIRKAFVVYLASHSRPIAELLRPNLKDIADCYEKEFKGMSFRDVTLQDLVVARERLVSDVRECLSERERLFLLSVKRGIPEWDALDIPGLENLPALRWKLANIKRLDKNKHEKLIENLEEVLSF